MSLSLVLATLLPFYRPHKKIVFFLTASVAQPNGTGDAKTVALALAKRPSPILKSMKEQGLDLPRWWEDIDDLTGDERDEKSIANEKSGSGILRPPPLDPLHNLEIVIGGTFTFGRLVSLPSRRHHAKPSGVATLLDYESRGDVVEGNGPARFQDVDVQYASADASPPFSPTFEDEAEESNDEGPMSVLLARAEEDFARAAAEAEAAAAKATRKEEKMKSCKSLVNIAHYAHLMIM